MALCDRPAVTLSGSKDQEDHSNDLTVHLSKVSDSFPDMAAGKSSTPSTSFFKILKDGGRLLPARNRSLFMAVFALAVAYTLLRRLVNDLAVRPSANELLRDVMAFSNGTNAISPDEVHQFLRDLAKDTWRLFWPGGAKILDVTVGNAVWIIALFAAVATYAGETCSFSALLGKARAQLKGTVLTVAFVYGLQVACVVVLVSAMAALLVVDRLFEKVPTGLLLMGWLLLAAATVFLEYLAFVCRLSVVVAVAEPGRHSSSAIGQAWRLLRGRRMRAVLLVAVIRALTFVCYRAYALARTHAVGSPASRLLLGFMYAVAVAGVEMFAVCIITAFYYECKERNDAATTTEYVKLASEELIVA